MKQLVNMLLEKMSNEGVISKDEAELYAYGIKVLGEMLICLGTCLGAALVFDIFIEMGIFFLIFIPLRSYAGGLHLEKFWACYLLSCFTFMGVILTAVTFQMPIVISIPIVLLLMIIVYVLYPVENKNREVEEDENVYFRKKLQHFLMIDLILTIAFALSNQKEYIQIVLLTFFVVVVTMIIGKYKNKIETKR